MHVPRVDFAWNEAKGLPEGGKWDIEKTTYYGPCVREVACKWLDKLRTPDGTAVSVPVSSTRAGGMTTVSV